MEPSAVADGGVVTLTGTVLEGNRPLPDALVELMSGPQAGGVVFTGAEGHFSMPGVTAGSIVLRASKTNYSTVTQGAIVAPGSNQPFRFHLEPFNPVAVRITGQVTDGNGAGVPDARILIRSPVSGSTSSDAGGAYSLGLSVLPPDPTRPFAWWGPTEVLAEKAGHEPHARYATLAARTPIDFRLHPIVRLAPGATTQLAVQNDDPYCDEVTALFTSDPPAWPCRIVRMSPPQAGTLTLDVEWDDHAAMLGLQVRDGGNGWRCCDARQSNRVAAGSDLVIHVVLINERANRPAPIGSILFRLSASVTRE